MVASLVASVSFLCFFLFSESSLCLGFDVCLLFTGVSVVVVATVSLSRIILLIPDRGVEATPVVVVKFVDSERDKKSEASRCAATVRGFGVLLVDESSASICASNFSTRLLSLWTRLYIVLFFVEGVLIPAVFMAAGMEISPSEEATILAASFSFSSCERCTFFFGMLVGFGNRCGPQILAPQHK